MDPRGDLFRLSMTLLVMLSLFAAIPAAALTPAPEMAITLPEDMTLCGEPVPTTLDDVVERFEKEMLLTLCDKPQVILWLKRSTRYLPFIAQELANAGLPDDLKYLAIIESALRPHAGSSKGAIGFWQMLPETARKYGLTVNDFIDQRRDIFFSTPAAVRYLKALHEKFGSWTLALAAYNMGEEGLDAEILEQNNRDYYQLYLPLETQRFVFRMLAVKLIFNDPKAYGFDIPSKDFYKPLNFDTVVVDCFQETPIRVVADAADTYFKRIKDLNPHFRGHYLQAGRHQIRLPQGSAGGFQGRFKALAEAHHEQRQQRIYVVQEGDSLSSIADKFEVPLAALLIWNRIDMRKTLYPGDRLVIYPREPMPPGP